MISCGQYGYIEIVCMYKHLIRLTLQSGIEIEGKALDTQYNADSEECIKIQTEDGENLQVLDVIIKMEVCLDNPHFQVIFFD